jgi:hypothetical protein
MGMLDWWSADEVTTAVRWIFFAIVTGLAAAAFATVVLRRVGYMKLGRAAPLEEIPADERHKKRGRSSVTGQVLGHRKLLRDIRSGVMHFIYFYGFIILQFGAADLIWKKLSGHPIPFPFYGQFAWSQELTVSLVFLLEFGVIKPSQGSISLRTAWRVADKTLVGPYLLHSPRFRLPICLSSGR